jgi:Tol biopolymer transport system component
MRRSPANTAVLTVAGMVLLVGCSSSSLGTHSVESVAPSATPSTDARAWIVYQSPTGLHRVLPDGTGDQPAVGTLSATARHPDFSRDGQRLAFVTDEPDGTRPIWVSRWDGSETERIVDCQAPCRDADGPAWSPDGTRIAFNRIDNVNGHNPGSKLQLVEVATKNVVTVLSTSGAEYVEGPRWSPDGKSLVVQITRYIDDGNNTDQSTGRTIAVVDLTATKPQLTIIRPFASYASYPDWDPAADRIIFAEGGHDPLNPAQAPQNLFTVRPDGTGLAQLTHQGTNDDGLWMPAFRFSNAQILATRVQRLTGDLTVVSVRPDGTVTDLGNAAALPGAHARERPMPAGN